MREIHDILAEYRQTLDVVEDEQKLRDEVTSSPEYVALQEQIDSLLKQQEDMLSVIPDSREEMEMDKRELMDWMQEHDVTQAGEFKAKTRLKRSVNVHKAWEALQGDYGLMEQISSVKIKSVEEMMRLCPEYKDALKDAIIDEGHIIIGIEC